MQGTDQEHHASNKILRSKPKIYEYLSSDADTALMGSCSKHVPFILLLIFYSQAGPLSLLRNKRLSNRSL